MRCLKPGLALLVGLMGLSLLVYILLVAGCGSGTPSNLAAAPSAEVAPELAAVVAEWVRAQQADDEDALEALYDPDYDFNGMTAEDMTEVRVLPETPHTDIDTIGYRFIPATADGHRHLVRARVTASGEVAADYVRHLAAGEPGGHTHDHEHGAALKPANNDLGSDGDLPLSGTVRAKAAYDIEWEFHAGNGGPLIVRQRTITGELSLGSGVSNPLIDKVHVDPHDPQAGAPVDVHGHYAALPPGGLIQVSIGCHLADAALDAGHFAAQLEAPHTAGDYVARVQAFGGAVQSRTAALTVVEQEVTVQ